jgi:hypothetical protein
LPADPQCVQPRENDEQAENRRQAAHDTATRAALQCDVLAGGHRPHSREHRALQDFRRPGGHAIAVLRHRDIRLAPPR